MELLRVENLRLVRRSQRRTWFGLREEETPWIEDLSFGLARREGAALVGDSREGLYQLALALLRRRPVAGGRIHFAEVAVETMPERTFRPLRRRLQGVFADHRGALSPDRTLREAFREVLDLWHRRASREERSERLERIMVACGLPEAVQDLFPAELDAVERQQAALARALLPGPELLICEGFLEGLDDVQRAELILVLSRVREEFEPALLVLGDDLEAAVRLTETVGVLHQGRLVEWGPCAEVVDRPAHERTRRLVACAA